MSHLFKVEKIKFLCSCGLLKPITGVYFCRHCLKLRCSNCVCHEVDTLYCPNCLENMPSAEARLKKNRCANCFDCPSCLHTLSTRVATIQNANVPDGHQSTPRKVYYLGCTGCRWSSRDVGLEDQTVATGGWPEIENIHSKRIQDLMEYYRGIAQREKFEAERKKGSRRKTSYLNVSEKYSLSSAFSSLVSRTSLGVSSPFSTKVDAGSSFEIEPSQALEEVPGLLDDIFTESVDLCSVTSLSQRLSSPEVQPDLTSDLYPLHKHILVKRSHRCCHCEHNLSKPEYNPSSIKFKIQLGAFYHVPEIRMVREVDLKWGVECTLELSLCNPTPHNMTVAILPFVPDAYNVVADTEQPSCTSLTSLSSHVRCVDRPREDMLSKMSFVSDVALPQGEMILAARDDTAEYDETDKQANFNDDPQVVKWRRANKVGVNVTFTPEQGSTEALVGLVLRYDYTNTVATNIDLKMVTIKLPIVINAGKVHE